MSSNTVTVEQLSPDQLAAYDAIMAWIGHSDSRTSSRFRSISDQPLLTLGGYAGCLSGDTVVRYNRGSRPGYRSIKLRDLYLKFNGLRGSGRGAAQRWSDLAAPTYLLSHWADGTVAGNRIVAVFESGVKKVLRIDLTGGRHLTLTSDHPVLTPSGEYVHAGDLAVGDEVVACGSLRTKKGGKGRMPIAARPPRVIVNTKYHPRGAYKKVRSNGVTYEYMRVPRARLVVEAAMNGLAYEKFVRALKSDAAASRRFKFLPKGTDVHHVDGDSMNDDISNLQALPHGTHAKMHGDEHEKHLSKDFTRIVKVRRIRSAGKEMTYDVQMEPPANNFVANGIFVHNTGKSTLVSLVADEIEMPAFVAYTGKAASVLRRKLRAAGTPTAGVVRPDKDGTVPIETRAFCGTIHSLIYRPCSCQEPRAVPLEKPCPEEDCPHETRWIEGGSVCDGGHFDLIKDEKAFLKLKAKNKFIYAKRDPDGTCSICGDKRWIRREVLDREYGVIIIDEASMVDDTMLRDLQSYGVPILAVGDHGQLPPVGGTGSLMKNPILRLEQIHRQAAGNPIIALSKMIREEGRLPETVDGDAVRFNRLRFVDRVIEERYEEASARRLLEMGLACYTNRRRVRLNAAVRRVRGHARTGRELPQKGEHVVCLRNIQSREGLPPIANGMRGVLTSDTSFKEIVGRSGTKIGESENHIVGTIAFPEDEIVAHKYEMLRAQFNRDKTFQRPEELERETGIYTFSAAGDLFDYGYAMTVHKMQGSQFDDLVVCAERPAPVSPEDWKRWLYTAVTRAASKLTILR